MNNTHLKVEGYANTNWAVLPSERKSTMGYPTLRGNLVTWKTKKQNVFAQSSA